MTAWEIGKLNKGKHLSDKTKEEISLKLKEGFRKGRTVWNEGKSLPKRTKLKISNSKKGSIPWNRGIPRTEVEKLKISVNRKGKPAWNKGKERTEEEKQRMREGAKRMWKRRKAKLT